MKIKLEKNKSINTLPDNIERSKPVNDQFLTSGVNKHISKGIFLAGFIALMFLNLKIENKIILGHGIPQFLGLYFIRIFIIAALSFLFVNYFSGNLFKGKNKVVSDSIMRELYTWGTIKLGFSLGDSETKFEISLKEVISLTIMGASAICVLILYERPFLFSRLVREDGPIETLSAIFCLFASAILLFSMVKCLKKKIKGKHSVIIILGFLSFVAFIIGMEEISWFQRYLNIATPDLFANNLKHEINIHNFATNYFESGYYFGSFMFFILLPFIDEGTEIFRKYSHFKLFIPGYFVLVCGVLASAYNYDMWNQLSIQFSFFITIFIVIFLRVSPKYSRLSFLLTLLLLCLMLTQFSFISFGYQMRKPYDVTEFKEFLIPLTLMIYSMEICLKVYAENKSIQS